MEERDQKSEVRGQGPQGLVFAIFALFAVILSGCAGYDIKVGLDYQDPRGDKAGVSVDVSKEVVTPSLESGTKGVGK